MVYLAIAVFSLHFIALPLVFRVRIFADSDKQDGKTTVKLFFIPLFVKKLNFDDLQDALNGTESSGGDRENIEKPRKKGGGHALKKFLLAVGVRIAKRVRVRALDLHSELGTGDAAATAVAVSSVLVLYAQACAYFDLPSEMGEVKPCYDHAKLFLEFDGIISICFADIIYAVCAQILSKFARRGKGAPHGKYIVAE